MSNYIELNESFSHHDFSFRIARIREMVDGSDDLKKRKVIMMKAGTGKQNHFAALPARELETVQMSYLVESFELAPRSHLAEAMAKLTNQALEAHKAATKIKRLIPSELFLELDDETSPTPLMTAN